MPGSEAVFLPVRRNNAPAGSGGRRATAPSQLALRELTMGTRFWLCLPTKLGLCFIICWHIICFCYQITFWRNVWDTVPMAFDIVLPIEPVEMLWLLRVAASTSWLMEPALAVTMASGFLTWVLTGPLEPCPFPFVAFTLYLCLAAMYVVSLLIGSVLYVNVMLASSTMSYKEIAMLGAYYCIACLVQTEWCRQAWRVRWEVNPRVVRRITHKTKGWLTKQPSTLDDDSDSDEARAGCSGGTCGARGRGRGRARGRGRGRGRETLSPLHSAPDLNALNDWAAGPYRPSTRKYALERKESDMKLHHLHERLRYILGDKKHVRVGPRKATRYLPPRLHADPSMAFETRI